MAAQRDWRFCAKCFALFFDGSPNKGVCPAGGGHQRHVEGLEFALPHDVSETPTAQGAWRFCTRCSALFFNGFPTKGVCPTGREHQAQGLVFVIPHDVSGTSGAQGGWRFCAKCNSMFFNGFPNAGVCPAGMEHRAEGFDFVLPRPASGAGGIGLE
jgi:hypothetical protein